MEIYEIMTKRNLAIFSTSLLVALVTYAQISHAQFRPGPAPALGSFNVGNVTTCESVRRLTGDRILGGSAGFQAGGNLSFSGGGQTFTTSFQSSMYQCAGVRIINQPGLDIQWPAFDVTYEDDDTEEEREARRLEWYGISTREGPRGRSGHNTPLFMNAHGVCRKVDNTANGIEPLFMDAIDAETWRSVHGVPNGGNPTTGGYLTYANRHDLPGVQMSVCCSPVMVEICGQQMQTEYAQMGDIVEVHSSNGGFARLRCAANNTFVPVDVIGICGGGGGGGGGGSPPGMHNPSTGGTISQGQFDSLSSAAQSDLRDQGYSPTNDVGTNARGAAAAAAAQEAAQKAAEEAAEEAKRAAEEEAARKKAEAEAAEREAQEDDDDEVP